MKDKIQKILVAFSSQSAIVTLFAYSIGMFVIFGIVTVLIPNTIFIRMTPITGLDYFFLISTSILGGLYFALPLNYCKANQNAVGGSLLGFLAFACPTCNKILVLLGYVFVNNVFDPLRPFLGAASIVVLLYAINNKLEEKTC